MSEISPETLKSRPWHAFQGESPHHSSRWRGWFKAEFIIPLVVIAILLVARAFVMAAVAGALVILVCLVRAFSPAGRRWVDRVLGGFASWVGHMVAVVLLAPVFFGVMTVVRLTNRLMGKDPLHLRSQEQPTFWLPSDLETRRRRYVKSMFCTERLAHSRLALLPLGILAVALLVAAEVGLRLYGLGSPLVYVQDPEVGYYPKPNQRVRYPGRIIQINNYGMRSPDVTPQKAPGHFRILMLGDSTLAGTRVGNAEIYSSLLQSNLNFLAGAPRCEVLNMGVNAWGPLHELAFVKKFGTFQADLVVICGPFGDCFRPLYGLERLPFPPAVHPPRFALETILYDFCWRYREKSLGYPAWASGYGERQEEQCAIGIEVYGQLVEYLQKQGAEVLLEMLPAPCETTGSAKDLAAAKIAPKLRERLASTGVPIGGADGIFKGAAPAEKIYHDGVHFERLGHRLYAAYLTDRLRQNSLRLKKFLERP